MKIVVLMKQVPNTTEMLIDKETGTLIRTGVDSIMNPDDTSALEAALKIKKSNGAEVIVITMGPPQAANMLRECYGRGVDHAILISDPAFAGADTWATSNTLAAAIKRVQPDLIFAGRQAIDGDTAQVGPQVAERLNIPQITYVSQIVEVTEDAIVVKKHYEDFDETLKVSFPCLLTTLEQLDHLRFMNVTSCWEAFDKPIEMINNQVLMLDAKDIGLKGSPTQVRKTFTRPVSSEVKLIHGGSDEAVKAILSSLAPYIQ